jgi:hypothetical protein
MAEVELVDLADLAELVLLHYKGPVPEGVEVPPESQR